MSLRAPDSAGTDEKGAYRSEDLPRPVTSSLSGQPRSDLPLPRGVAVANVDDANVYELSRAGSSEYLTETDPDVHLSRRTMRKLWISMK